MSSFYDDAAILCAQYLKEGNRKKAIEVVEAARHRVLAYWLYLEGNVLKRDAVALKTELMKKRIVLHACLLDEGFDGGGYSSYIERMHTCGHDIGLKFHLRGGRLSGDNPYYPGYFKKLSEEQRFQIAPEKCVACGGTNIFLESAAEGYSCKDCGSSDSDEG